MAAHAHALDGPMLTSCVAAGSGTATARYRNGAAGSPGVDGAHAQSSGVYACTSRAMTLGSVREAYHRVSTMAPHLRECVTPCDDTCGRGAAAHGEVVQVTKVAGSHAPVGSGAMSVRR